MSTRHATAPRLRLIACAAGLACTLPAWADDAAGAKPDQLDTVVVTGMRASLEKAQDRKRNADQIVDTIVADDIGKLPDANVAEALQRVTGVQVSRNRGEGDQVQVRGLSETETLLNGRDIFTAGKERGLSFQDVPAELIAGADVYKTPVADQIEGGIGGVIDLRMHRPLDFTGLKLAGTVKETYADLAGKRNPEGSFLVSERWKLEGGGDFGALLSVAKQKRSYRADTEEMGAPAQLADGSGTYAPVGQWLSYELGSRDRTGITASLQYRPSAAAEVYLDVDHTELKTRTDTYGYYGSPYWANWSAGTNLGALWPVAGTIKTDANGNFVSGSFWGAQMTTSSYIADDQTRTSQYALGGSYKLDGWTYKSELAYTTSDYARLYEEARLGAWTNNAQYRYDLSTETPSGNPVLGAPTDLTNPAQYYASKALYFRQQNNGSETSWRGDVEHRLDGDGPFTRLRAGVRLSDRSADSAEINTIDSIWSGAATSNIGGLVSSVANSVGLIPFSNLLRDGGSGTFPRQWLAVTDMNLLRDPATFRADLGLTVPSFDDPERFSLSEKTSAVYGVVDFDSALGGIPWSGNLGLRYVDVRDHRNYTEISSGTATPRSIDASSNYALPSLNMRFDLTSKLVARVSASKVMTLPNFDQLTPSLSLNANDLTGYLGNPALKALTAKQVDAALEYYLTRSDFVYGTAFYKKVNGFIQTSTIPLVYKGTTYTVSTPTNGEDGTIRGLELGYQGFATSLPGWLKGFGMQANFTLVDSSAPGVLAGQRTALQGLSRTSYNLIGMYDYDDVSLRLAYTYRGRYLSTTGNYYPDNGNTIAQTPIYMKGYGILDGYASYSISSHLKVAFEVNNITRTVRRSYYGVNDQPMGNYGDDRRYALSLHMDL
ncbi:MAG: TonB-dependent receptor [Pelomonas sp.]|nr:TonB-dependent receptor [Roseateles sp.]